MWQGVPKSQVPAILHIPHFTRFLFFPLPTVESAGGIWGWGIGFCPGSPTPSFLWGSREVARLTCPEAETPSQGSGSHL